MQTKLTSLKEVALTVGSGFLIAWLLMYLLRDTSLSDFTITVIFTFTSLARNYLWRRIFNA